MKHAIAPFFLKNITIIYKIILIRNIYIYKHVCVYVYVKLCSQSLNVENELQKTTMQDCIKKI